MSAWIEPAPEWAPDDAPLFEIPDQHANGNYQRGHISLVPAGERHAAFSFADMGSTLHVWAYTAGRIDAQAARELGQALIAWADRKDSHP